MSLEETEAYAEGFKMGWVEHEKYVLNLIKVAPDVDYVGEFVVGKMADDFASSVNNASEVKK